jgi:hypothetical protein
MTGLKLNEADTFTRSRQTHSQKIEKRTRKKKKSFKE